MRVFPRNAIEQRKILIVAININCLCMLSFFPATHRSCASVSVCFPASLDKLSCAIIPNPKGAFTSRQLLSILDGCEIYLHFKVFSNKTETAGYHSIKHGRQLNYKQNCSDV